MPPTDNHDKPTKTAWLNAQNAVTIGSILIAVGSTLTTVRSLDNRVTNLEAKEERRSQLWSEMNADIKVMRAVMERVEKKIEAKP